MVVLRRETWNVGGYMEVSGAPMNLGQNSGSCDNGCGIPAWRPSTISKSE